MRPPEARQISMARSRAQSECGELSTGTKTSLYGMTPPSAVMGSLNGFSLNCEALLCRPSELEMRDDTRASAPVNSRTLHPCSPAERLGLHASRDTVKVRRARYETR